MHQFLYRTSFENGLTEYEFDHVYVGFSDKVPKINPNEVSEYKYVNMDELKQDISIHPENYTSWFKICLEQIDSFMEMDKKKPLNQAS